MLKIELCVSNEAARRTRDELRTFLAAQANRMSADPPDPHGSVTSSYVVMRTLLAKLDAVLRSTEQARQPAAEPQPVRVEVQWGGK